MPFSEAVTALAARRPVLQVSLQIDRVLRLVAGDISPVPGNGPGSVDSEPASRHLCTWGERVLLILSCAEPIARLLSQSSP